AIAQDAGVVDDDVDPAERVDRGLDDAVRRLPVRDAVGARDRRAAFRLDLVDDLLRRAGVLAFARDRGADVIHDHLRALGGHRVREIPPDSAAGAGDHHYLALEHGPIP